MKILVISKVAMEVIEFPAKAYAEDAIKQIKTREKPYYAVEVIRLYDPDKGGS